MRLNCEERGIYRELLDHLYYTGFLPNDPKTLIKIASTTEKEWKRSHKAVLSCFIEKDGGLVNQKASEVITRLDGYSNERAEAGKKGAMARWNGSAKESGIAKPSAENAHPQPQPQPAAITPATDIPRASPSGVEIYNRPAAEPSPPKPNGVDTVVQDAFVKKSAPKPERKNRTADMAATERLANILGEGGGLGIVEPQYIDVTAPRREVREDPAERKAAEERFVAALRKERPELDDAAIERLMRRATA